MAMNGKPIDACQHPRSAWMEHPTRPGKHICRACGVTGTIMEQVGPFVVPKVDLRGQ
jgi:hypothetical protein